MTRRLIAGTGWKMNHTAAETTNYAARLSSLIDSTAAELDLFVLPPFTSLPAARQSFSNLPVAIGGQNMHWEPSGSWTGEISAPMLAEAGCRYVELAHSERLQHFGETYGRVRQKLNIAVTSGLTPILCLGEVAADKLRGAADQVIRDQLETALADLKSEQLPSVVLAYEPRWAIGGSFAAPPDYVAERHGALRAALRERFGGDAAERVRIIYGGSVTPENAAALMQSDNVDGLFVGRAAWTAEGFAKIISIVSNEAIRRRSK